MCRHRSLELPASSPSEVDSSAAGGILPPGRSREAEPFGSLPPDGPYRGGWPDQITGDTFSFYGQLLDLDPLPWLTGWLAWDQYWVQYVDTLMQTSSHACTLCC